MTFRDYIPQNSQPTEDDILAVKRGADFLDTHYPEWYNSINLSELAMWSGRSCVLGQVGKNVEGLFGPYTNSFVQMKHLLGLDDRDIQELGFYAPSSDDPDVDPYAGLQLAWGEYIEERQAQ